VGIKINNFYFKKSFDIAHYVGYKRIQTNDQTHQIQLRAWILKSQHFSQTWAKSSSNRSFWYLVARFIKTKVIDRSLGFAEIHWKY